MSIEQDAMSVVAGEAADDLIVWLDELREAAMRELEEEIERLRAEVRSLRSDQNLISRRLRDLEPAMQELRTTRDELRNANESLRNANESLRGKVSELEGELREANRRTGAVSPHSPGASRAGSGQLQAVEPSGAAETTPKDKASGTSRPSGRPRRGRRGRNRHRR